MSRQWQNRKPWVDNTRLLGLAKLVVGTIAIGLLFATVFALAARVADRQQRQTASTPRKPTDGATPAPPVTGGNASTGNASTGNANGNDPKDAPQNIVWNLGHPPERLRFPINSQVEFTVSSADKELKDLRLAGSTLQDATSFLRLDASQMQLCTDDGECNGEINVPAHTTQKLTVKILDTFAMPGIFAGDIALRIADKPETQSFKLTVYSRTREDMVLGAMTIAIGLGLYFLVNVYLHRRIAADDALVPAYQLRDTLGVIKKKLEDAATLTQVPLTALLSTLAALDAQLTPQALAAHLPPILILPWSAGTAWQESFKSYLTPIADKVAGLVVLANSGIQLALGYWAKNPVPVETALRQIDALAPAVTSAASAQTQLAPILQTLEAAVNPPAAAALAPLLQGAPVNVIARLFTLPPDTHALQIRLLRNTLWVWWLIALIALASGFYAVVLQNFGFGSATDYIKCFFWGLGFSVAGTQLDQLTQTAVTGNFGISIPKA
jgi:hypothetical protein